MTVRTKDCGRLVEIDARRAAGRPIPPEDEGFVGEHLARCPECLLEHEVLAAIAAAGNTGALPELDDITRRRLTEEIVARADAFSSLAEEEGGPAAERGRGAWRRGAVLAGSLIAASVIAVLAWVLTAHPETGRRAGAPAPAPVSLSPRIAGGQLALVAGQVAVGERPARLGDRLGLSAELATGVGRTVVVFDEDISVSVHPDTRIAFSHGARGAIEASLSSGEVQVSLAPRNGRPAFHLHTHKGTVEVKGTVFSVSVTRSDVKVRVLRGEVAVREADRRPSTLQARSGMAMGDTRTWSLTVQEEKLLLEEMRRLDLLDARDDTAVEIRSVPEGAEVEIDNVPLGQTPVSAAIRAGYRQLTVETGTAQGVQELLDVTSGDRVSRVFDLTGAPGAGRAEAPVSPAARGSRQSLAASDPSAQDLLRQAQLYRVEQDWTRAARAYARLIETRPETDEARAALVSLGEIHLEKLAAPQAALRAFERYLAPSRPGPLAPEALFGKAGALRALGREDAEKATLEQLIERYPGAVQTSGARDRLAAMANP